MALTVSEAAAAKGISRNAIWLAIGRGVLTTRKTSGGIWLIDEDDRWLAYQPRKNKRRRDPSAETERE